MENKDFIISKFKEVKSLEYVPSNRANNTGIGKTFEDYIGVVENNLDEPDLAGFEIKSHRGASCSYTGRPASVNRTISSITALYFSRFVL